MNLSYKNLPDNTVLSLIAPTASGKTDLACRLYDTGKFELISVDSALIYQDMNIGTAKPTDDELASYPHHLVNIITPTQTYNVASFVLDVETLIKQIHERGKIPLLVGGTMMYYMALFDGLSAVPDTDPVIRQKVMDWLQSDGIGELYAYLQTYDPKICERLKLSDTQRITRAVEVHLQTGTAMSQWQQSPKRAISQNPNQYWLALSVEPQRAWLHERIAKRLDMMWAQGLVDEVIGLLYKYPTLKPDMPSMRCVGYRQVLEFLAIMGHDVMHISPSWERFATDVRQNWQKNTKNSKNPQKILKNCIDMACQDMKNKALYATRQLAKRQATWQRSLARLRTPTITDTNQDFMTHSPVKVSFHCIKEVEKHLLP
ncbi:tRNA (adenosine(37)-N6)-dimethylallyltransferase MiaA [Moraxella sp. VT-16-12]|uniref:tRNA (adenosine(37)-N6)-dimethylallyltransferase MiaA n=1 Tax=Moraxella sp. VT-16-12 TaxID=2014877 RepID=UPI000B7DCEC4|nr:tRNA (adenosine(37)-N6)-dimethylallyltransferase MiaA [Moraxella sp. VT-16-12]TWV83443.1 tRNA (adenosine(37)-N6)-dimethylallyltransferase MiaA [Moraxella sp. VT-16-12]